MKRWITVTTLLAVSSLAVWAQDQPQITPRVAPTAKESRLDQPATPEPSQAVTVPSGQKSP